MSEVQPVIHPIYSLPRTLLGQNRVSVLSAHTPSDAAQILRKIGISRGHVLEASVHLDHAANHFLAWARSQFLYGQKLDESAMALWGRKWEVTDYKVSAIGSDQFSEAQKVDLRALSMAIRSHQDIARAHAWAGGMRGAGMTNMESAAVVVAQGALYSLLNGAMEVTAARLMKMAELERSGEAVSLPVKSIFFAVRAASEDPSLVGRLSWACTSDFKLRLAKAEHYIVEGKSPDAVFDGCFELADADALVGALAAKAKLEPQTPLARNLFDYFPANSCQEMLETKPQHLDYEGWANVMLATADRLNHSMRVQAQRGG